MSNFTHFSIIFTFRAYNLTETLGTELIDDCAAFNKEEKNVVKSLTDSNK